MELVEYRQVLYGDQLKSNKKSPFRNDREETFLLDWKLGLNNSWDDPACYSVVNDCSKETHHRETTVHLLSCFPVVSFFVHHTKPGMICPVVRYAPISAQHPTNAA